MGLKTKHSEFLLEAGLDEAGRGCLAGPVYAAAVILDPKKPIKGLNDSKKLNEKTRHALRDKICSNALYWSVAWVDHKEIDRINILNSSILAMHKAIKKLKVKPEFLTIDGNRFHRYGSLPHACIIKGDGKYKNIAAASILAKTFRDDFMEEIHLDHPVYGWNENKGYPTAFHREMIVKHGPSPFHRNSFRLYPEDEQKSLF